MSHGPLSRSAGVAAYGDFYILGGQTSSGEATDKVRNTVFSNFSCMFLNLNNFFLFEFYDFSLFE